VTLSVSTDIGKPFLRMRQKGQAKHADAACGSSLDKTRWH
jgi:hypothetical protein